jgi:hypothetical protein
MSLQRDGSVTIGVEGAEDVAAAAAKALRPWEDYSRKAQSAVVTMGKAVGDTFKQSAQDIARGVTGLAAFDFGQQIQSAIKFREESARMAAVSGRGADELRAKFAAQEKAIYSSRQENEAFAKSFGRLTGNYKDAAKAADSLGVEALYANRSLAEMGGIGKVLYTATGSIDGMADALGSIHAQAGTASGGLNRLRDNVEHLGAAFSMLSRNGNNVKDLIAFAGGFGKGLSPEAQQRVQQRMVGFITADPRRTERMLRSQGELGKGESILDENGQVKDLIGTIAKWQRAEVKKRGVNARRIIMQENNLGPEAGAALMNFDEGAARRAAAMSGGTGGNPLTGTAEGKFIADQLALRGKQQEIADKAIPAAGGFMAWASENPALAAGVALLGPGLAAKGTGAALGAGGRLLAGMLGIGGGAGGVGAGAGAAAAGGAAAVGSGTVLAAEGAGMTLAQITAGETAGGLLAGAGLGTGLGIGGVVGGGALAAGAVLHDIGEDRATMGARYLSEHAGMPGMLTGQVKQVIGAANRGRITPNLLAQIESNPELGQVASGALERQIDISGLSDAMRAAVRDAVSQLGDRKITITDATKGNVEIIEENARPDQ